MYTINRKIGDNRGYFGHVGIFGAWLGKLEFWKNFHTFESVKNYINAYISHLIRDRIVKIQYDMYLYDINMATNTNLKYTNSSSNYYVIILVQNLKKLKNRKFPIFSHSRSTKCRFEASNNREEVVVYAKYVVKRRSKPRLAQMIAHGANKNI